MTELEKVIKGLECCITDGPDCPNDCPYIGDCNRKQLHTDALALLKTQEAVRPRIGIIYNDDGSKSYFLHCPLDGTTLDEGDKYCRKCGRPVKWG